MNPPGYRSMLRGKVEGSRFELRLELVRYAQEHGIWEAARAFRAIRRPPIGVDTWERLC